MTVLAIFYDHWKAEREARPSFRRPLQLWKKVVWYKANPRTLDYMTALANERFPGVKVIQATSSLPLEARSASGLVLLYPDSIGLGFDSLEREIAKGPEVRVEVLNGRRRQFLLDGSTKRALYLRRFLEWTMLVECVAGAALLVSTPFLLLLDWARGRT